MPIQNRVTPADGRSPRHLHVLTIVFDWLYVLRNQVIHVGATWNSFLNRVQVRHGTDIIGRVTPVVIHLMMERHGALRGEPSYPVVE